jgi:hypothetical protein
MCRPGFIQTPFCGHLAISDTPPPQLVRSRTHGLQFPELLIASPDDVAGRESIKRTKSSLDPGKLAAEGRGETGKWKASQMLGATTSTKADFISSPIYLPVLVHVDMNTQKLAL